MAARGRHASTPVGGSHIWFRLSPCKRGGELQLSSCLKLSRDDCYTVQGWRNEVFIGGSDHLGSQNKAGCASSHQMCAVLVEIICVACAARLISCFIIPLGPNTKYQFYSSLILSGDTLN